MKRITIALACLCLLTLGACAKKPTPTAAPATVAQPAATAPAAEETPTVVLREEPVVETPAPESVSVKASDGSQLETVYFDYDSYTLSAEARSALERNARWLKEKSSVSVTIEGHCDERGSDEYNLALGERRALAVKNYLATLGVAAGRLAVLSYGEERPAVAGQDESSWAQNRRAEFK